MQRMLLIIKHKILQRDRIRRQTDRYTRIPRTHQNPPAHTIAWEEPTHRFDNVIISMNELNSAILSGSFVWLRCCYGACCFDGCRRQVEIGWLDGTRHIDSFDFSVAYATLFKTLAKYMHKYMLCGVCVWVVGMLSSHHDVCGIRQQLVFTCGWECMQIFGITHSWNRDGDGGTSYVSVGTAWSHILQRIAIHVYSLMEFMYKWQWNGLSGTWCSKALHNQSHFLSLSFALLGAPWIFDMWGWTNLPVIHAAILVKVDSFVGKSIRYCDCDTILCSILIALLPDYSLRKCLQNFPSLTECCVDEHQKHVWLQSNVNFL